MSKYLTMAFTGSTVLSPDFPDDLAPIPGPLIAVMPAANRVRRSTFETNQIDTQFAFLKFPISHLVVTQGDRTSRNADYTHPDLRTPTTGLCFLGRETVTIEPQPIESVLTFDSSPTTTFPRRGSTGARWIARWRDFAPGGQASLKPLDDPAMFDPVRIIVPGGHVSAGFVSEPIARINFDYGPRPESRPFAQEIVVTLSFDDSVETVTMVSSHQDSSAPFRLTFHWYDRNEIKVLFGNGSFAAIQSVLEGSVAGQDHQGDFDFEFEVTYDVVNVLPDQLNRFPLPRIMSNEILRVPCIASMVSGSAFVVEQQPTIFETLREPSSQRRTGRTR